MNELKALAAGAAPVASTGTKPVWTGGEAAAAGMPRAINKIQLVDVPHEELMKAAEESMEENTELLARLADA